MDRVGADFNKCVKMIADRLQGNPVPIQIPIGVEEGYVGLVDLVTEKALVWDSDESDKDLGLNYQTIEIPSELQKAAHKARESMLEVLADFDDNLMEKFVEGVDIEPEYLYTLIRKLTLQLDIVPVLCGSAFKNKGIQPLLDAINNYLPSPLDLDNVEGLSADNKEIALTRARNKEDSFSSLAFKIVSDSFVGLLTYVRIYSGAIKVGNVVLNARTGKKERIQKIIHMHANTRKEVQEAKAGSIAALVGLKNIATGDTLCDIAKPIRFESIVFPEPVIYDFDSTTTYITGSGKTIDSKRIGFAMSQSVSPVAMFFSPTKAAILPALASCTSFLVLACICIIF
jgi:elongation factor G